MKRLFASLLLAAAMAVPAYAASADFYKGRTVFIIIGYSP